MPSRAPDPSASGPEPTTSDAAPLRPPPRPTATRTAGSGRAYDDRRPVHSHGHGYVGRAPSLVPDTEDDGSTAALPAPSGHEAGQQAQSASPYETGPRVLRVLPLGAGLLLVGLGLGFLGLRLRRG